MTPDAPRTATLPERRHAAGGSLALLAALGLLALPAGATPAPLRAAGLLLLTVALPGALLLENLARRSGWRPDRVERFVYSGGAGVGVAVWGTLYLSYLPGPLRPLPTPAAFVLLNLLLIALLLWPPRARQPAPPATPLPPLPRGRAAVLLVILCAAGLLRLGLLGRAEFQGDEATPIVRAAAVVQGYEGTLFLQRRGPVDTLLPALQMALLGPTTEGSQRLVYALAGLLAVLALYRLGSRLGGRAQGHRVGLAAALLLALEGYAVAFGRIAHYESVVLLMALLVVDLLVAAWQAQRAQPGVAPPGLRTRLLLAAFLAATGLAAHYDGVIVLLPAFVTIVLLARAGAPRRTLVRGVAAAALLGVALSASFYLPYLLHPAFATTFAFYRRTLLSDGGAGLFVNNLLPFAESAALYSGPLTLYALALLLLGAAARVVARQPRAWAVAGAALWVAAPLLLAWRPGAPAAVALPMTLALGMVAAAPRLAPGERLLWLWFALPFLQAMFLTKTPGLHYYTFVPPLLLLCAWTAARLYGWLRAHGGRGAVLAAGAAGALLVAAALLHLGSLFLGDGTRAQAAAAREAPRFWLADRFAHEPLLYGMPHTSGLKTPGVLYAQGRIQGDYAANIDRWIGAWYLRGAPYCEDRPDLVLLDAAGDADDAADLREEMGDAFAAAFTVAVDGRETLALYQRGAAGPAEALDAAPFAQTFDRTLAGPWLPLSPHAVEPKLTEVAYRFGDGIQLTGVGLFATEAAPGGALAVTTRWRLLQPVGTRYTLSLQVVGPADRILGQRDSMPSCETGPTSDWETHETPYGYEWVPIAPDTPPGRYPLLLILYDPETQERLPLYDASGAPLGSAALVAEVTIRPDNEQP